MSQDAATSPPPPAQAGHPKALTWVVDREGRVCAQSRAWTEVSRVEIGCAWTTPFLPTDREYLEQLWNQARGDGQPFPFHARIPDGTRIQGLAFPLDSGAWQFTALPWTPGLPSEMARGLDEQERSRAILSALPDLMFINSREGVFLDYHAPRKEQLAAPPEVFLGRKPSDIFLPALARRFEAAYRSALDSGEIQVVEYRLPDDPFESHWEARVVPCGRDRTLSIVRDITERAVFERLIQESERRFHELANFLPVGIYETDLFGRLRFLNFSGQRTLGVAPEDVDAGLDFSQFLAPTERERVRSIRKRILESGEEGRIECQARRSDGCFFPVLIHASPITEGNRCFGTRGVIIDMTELKRAEQGLADTKALLEAAFNQNPSAMLLAGTPCGSILHLNTSCQELLGILDEPCLLGRVFMELEPSWQEFTVKDEPIPMADNVLALALRGIHTHGRTQRILRKDGTEIWCKVRGTPVQNRYGKRIAALVIYQETPKPA